jgi:signal transduction histidine kinase
MRSLFFKIFLWFWLLVVLIGGMVELSYFMALVEEDRWRSQATSLLAQVAPKAAEISERSGADALNQYLRSMRGEYGVRAYFLDAAKDYSFDLDLPGPVRERAALVQRNPRVPVATYGFAAEQATGPSGRKYILVLQYRRLGAGASPMRAALETFYGSTTLRLTAILLIGGVFCFWLARHITRPVVELRTAVGNLAEGQLDARVGQALRQRQDEIGQLGRDFDRMAERIEALIRGQRELLGDVSHELRSPLARLMVALSLARQCHPEDAPAYLDRIRTESERLDQLIGQLLTLARIESKVDEGHRKIFDLAELVQEVAADGDFEARAQNRGVTVTSEEPCPIRGISEMMRSAIENVVRNAIRFTREGTIVEIKLRREDGAKNSRAILSVRDHGPGIPEELLPSVFLPFRRAPAPSDEEPQGTGLGLAITERVARLHGGSVRAFNARDGGLVMEMELPLGSSAG